MSSNTPKPPEPTNFYDDGLFPKPVNFDKNKKWTYTSIRKKLLTLRKDWGNAEKCSIGWTGYHHVKVNDWSLVRESNLKLDDYTWLVNDEPIVLSRKHHYELDALIWRMDKWDSF